MSFPLPVNERQRLKSLELLEILDTEAEQEFDDLTRLAAQICEVPISLVSLIDATGVSVRLPVIAETFDLTLSCYILAQYECA